MALFVLRKLITFRPRERGGSVVECRTPEWEVGGSKPTAAVLCPWARHFTPRKYWQITQEAVAPSRHDWKIVDWDVKPQHKQNKLFVLHKLILQTRMRSHPVGLDVWFFCRTHHLLPYVVCEQRRLWRDWAFTDYLCDKYHNLMSWLS